MMTEESDRTRDEEIAIHRARCAVSEVLNSLNTLGVHQLIPAGPEKLKPVHLDPAQRRNFLVLLSELEEHVKTLKAFSSDLARDIEFANRSINAVSAYRQTGLSVKKFTRQRH